MPKVSIARTLDESNPSVRSYHSRTKLVEEHCDGMSGMALPKEEPFLEAVLAIPGIEIAHAGPWTLVVMKSRAFEWSEIESPILALLASMNMGEGRLMELQQKRLP